MAEGTSRRVWTYRMIFLGVGFGIILFRILPFETGIPGLPGPDFILCIAFAWILRQPGAITIGSLLFLILLSDFLLQRPPGLWTMLALIGAEALRNRRAAIAEVPFLIEWAVVSGTILLMVLAQRVILWILVVDQPNLGLSLMEGLATLAIYPLVVLVSKFLLGMDKLPPTDAEVG